MDNESHIKSISNQLDNEEQEEIQESPDTKETIEFPLMNRFEVRDLGLRDTCDYCGLSTNLWTLFLNPEGDLQSIFGHFKKKAPAIMDYLMRLSEELFGDVATLSRAINISEKKFGLIIHKIVIIGGIAYHPECGKKFLISNSQSPKKEVK